MLLAALIGCQREPQPAASATSQPATAASPPVTSPAALEPSYLSIDGRPLAFPPARIRIDSDDGRVVALLFSDDPKDAVDGDNAGPGYYLELPLELKTPPSLDGAVHISQAASGDREESPFGIFLHGRRLTLLPDELRVEINGEAPAVQVDLVGVFTSFDATQPAAPARRVQVQGHLTAQVQYR
jgi:hypothetical protein